MRNIIQFKIYKGERKYVAESIDLPIVTEGDTLNEVMKNIKEAVELHLEHEDAREFDIAPKPSILVNFELTSAYA